MISMQTIRGVLEAAIFLSVYQRPNKTILPSVYSINTSYKDTFKDFNSIGNTFLFSCNYIVLKCK